MSSHYVYVACPVPDCPVFASMYTGDEVLDGFENDQWEQETILVPCDEHMGWTPPPTDQAAHDARIASEAGERALVRAQRALAGEDTVEWARKAHGSMLSYPHVMEVMDDEIAAEREAGTGKGAL